MTFFKFTTMPHTLPFLFLFFEDFRKNNPVYRHCSGKDLIARATQFHSSLHIFFFKFVLVVWAVQRYYRPNKPGQYYRCHAQICFYSFQLSFTHFIYFFHVISRYYNDMCGHKDEIIFAIRYSLKRVEKR